ncbi:MAG: DUF2586 domain-containing protein [Spirochaetaceae bacterium]|jgi:hypothetical protein|nr:DUF2586 domain-containing protein [Spirochaetaceae bacterium]
MALPDVRNRIKDGAMGVLGADATGIFAAIGVAAKPSNGIITFSDPDQVDGLIGDGPLRDLLVSSLSIAKTTIYAVALEGTVPGTNTEVSPGEDNTGAGTVTVAGSPRNEYDITVEIQSEGALNGGVFRVTIDGLPGKLITIPAGGTYPIPDTGITLTFVPNEGTFKEGDTFTFSTTAPTATSGEVLQAVDAILEAKKAIEFIAVTGISAAPLWAALATKAEGAAEIFQYLFFVCQARYKGDTETYDQWVNALTGSERGTVASTRLQVIAGYIEEADSNGQVDTRGLIGTYCGKLAGLPVHQGPDAVRSGSITAATAIKPDGINDGHIEALKNAGYVTARKIIGLNGIYVTSGQMMSEAGSDYDLVERRRVMDKACRQVRTAQLIYLNDVVKVGGDGSPEGLEMFVAQSENPLKIMENAEEISSGYVVIPAGQNILSTKTLRTKVRIVPLGKLSYIENEIAYSNPALEVSNG